MAKFGRTWWGQQWLAALDGIDFSNRLPRGRRYANNGSVRSIEVTDEAVHAEVKGSRRTPYRVRVALARFGKAKRQATIEAIERSPVLLSRLLNRQLPPEVLERLDERDIALLPRTWRDMNADCSCPDSALPCKHIAATIYLIANEIDKDPFLIFTLHGLDLATALQARTGVASDSLSTLPAVADDWQTVPAVDAAETADDTPLAGIDFSCVPPLEGRIFTILSSEPLFHSKDFRKTLATQYGRTRRAARAFDRAAQTPWTEAEQFDRLTAEIDDAGELIELRADGHPIVADDGREGEDALAEALAGLHALPGEREPRLAQPLRLWRSLLRFALKLTEQGAYVPSVGANDAGASVIRWQPARLDDEVDNIFQQLAALCPPDLVLLARRQSRSRRRKRAYGDAGTQISAALRLILGLFVRRGFAASADAKADDPVKQLFFAGTPVRFAHFATEETPRLIRHWLRRLSLGERQHRLRLVVEEDGDDHLAVHLGVEGARGLQPVAGWLAQSEASAAKATVLADLAVLAEYFPDVEQLYAVADDVMNDGGESAVLTYELAAFTPILREVLPALRMLGIAVVLPKALRNLARPQASLALSSSSTETEVSYLNLDQLLDFDWQVAIGDARISVDEFRRLVAETSGLVRLRDQYVLVEEGEVHQLLKRLEQPPSELSRAELLQAGLSGELDGAAVSADADARRLFEQLVRPEAPPPVPAALEAQLRPYQQRGFEWLAGNAEMGFGSLLADDMGLGKTLQVIAMLLHLKETGRLAQTPALVVVPTSLLTNWRHELEAFAPTLAVQVYHGPRRKLTAATHDVILTSYGLVRSDAKTLTQPHWAAVVIDEAQNIKNPSAAQTRAVKRLPGGIRVALSGTPVENGLREYWSVFDFINPGYLGNQKRFAEQLAGPIEREHDQGALTQFRSITAPFILRRVKTDKQIIADLPDKIEANRYCSLSTEQASLYQNTVDTIMGELAQTDEGAERRGIVFKLLNALKQICNSPAQFLDHGRAEIEASGKLAAFVEIMREIEAADENALIFTQYTAMGELLVSALREALGLEVPFLHGGRSRKQRDELVAAFQHERGPRAMLVSLKAGGTGLNLTAASHVIHYDLWWNPAVERQATDRAYRIGQQRNVTVHRMITEHTFEEKIDAMIQRKKELANLTVASGERWIGELSDNELAELVSLSGAVSGAEGTLASGGSRREQAGADQA
jgi:uncharacterized Zn finger protein/superfamily II DNA or RNA helicase